MKLWKAAAVSFLAMCFQDVLATCMVIFEARLNALLAGTFDALGWFFGLACSYLAIESVLKTGLRTKRSLTIIGAVTLANFAGTYAGVAIGSALTHH